MAFQGKLDPEMQEIFEGFMAEAQELLDSASSDLMSLDEEPSELDEILNRIFRSFHTIKGNASFMGLAEVAEITHHAEDILNKLRKHELENSTEITDTLLEVHDLIKEMLELIQAEEDELPNYQHLIDKISILKEGGNLDDNIQQESSAVDQVLANKEMVTKPGDFSEDELNIIDKAFAEVNKELVKRKADEIGSTVDKVLANEDMFKEPGDFSEEELVLINAAFDEVNNELKGKNKDNSIEQEVIKEAEPKKEIPQKAEKEKPAKKAPPKEIKKEDTKAKKEPAAKDLKAKPVSDSIRIDVERMESLMDLSGELVLGRNRIVQISEKLESRIEEEEDEDIKELLEASTQLDFVTSEIQTAVMKMRMVPVGKLFQKAPRIVRDLSKEFGKSINLIKLGEDTEIDRGIIEELNDPLVHMIRNSCDHGIETKEERLESGKPAKGTVTLDASQEGNNIVLKISDDGKGMNADKLKEKAFEKGIITEEQVDSMTEREAYQLIFAPGFSTAAKVSSVSGRGVGMDVVRTNITKLKGMIEIESELGVGTTFIIKLPLTLAIIQGLLVKIQKETYTIPLSSVVEVVAVSTSSLHKVNQQEVIKIREDVFPIIHLDTLLGLPASKVPLNERNVVVVGLGNYRLGLVVDKLLGQQEIVIKSLGDYLGNIEGISGSTILGDGRVIMIIDVADIVRKVYANKNDQLNSW